MSKVDIRYSPDESYEEKQNLQECKDCIPTYLCAGENEIRFLGRRREKPLCVSYFHIPAPSSPIPQNLLQHSLHPTLLISFLYIGYSDKVQEKFEAAVPCWIQNLSCLAICKSLDCRKSSHMLDLCSASTTIWREIASLEFGSLIWKTFGHSSYPPAIVPYTTCKATMSSQECLDYYLPSGAWRFPSSTRSVGRISTFMPTILWLTSIPYSSVGF